MKEFIKLISVVFPMLFGLPSCYNQIEPISLNEELKSSSSSVGKNYDPMWLRHYDSSLKILAIGNSFTKNGTAYLPILINNLNGDSICIATLTQPDASLEDHWNNYINKSQSYSLNYSDKGRWLPSDIKTLDEALILLDWDIIVIQQVSGQSGLYYRYQPYLDYLVESFRDSNPGVMLAWHYTWAYTEWSQHIAFKNYDCDSEKMFNAIIDAGDQASANFELSIPSANLIRQMREDFPEKENGFSNDGCHITDNIALYALSSLWYEILIHPFYGTSSIAHPSFPSDVSVDSKEKVLKIIKELTHSDEDWGQSSSVGMIYID